MKHINLLCVALFMAFMQLFPAANSFSRNAAPCTTTFSTTSVSVCYSALPYNWNGTILSKAGTYKDTISNFHGCDSILTLNLSISNFSVPSASISGAIAVCKNTTAPNVLFTGASTIPWVSVKEGNNFTVALRADGTVWAWGVNTYGQLGNGTKTSSLVPVQVTGLSNVSEIAVGANHVSALVNGGVKSWGYNVYGQLGNGTTVLATTPVQVSGLTSGVTAIAAGANFGCAIQNGSVKCWGENANGQLGNGTTTNSSVPVTVTGISGATAVAAGLSHALAIVNGAIKAWGYNLYGQLGNNSTVNSSVPVAVNGIVSGCTKISAKQNNSAAIVNGSAKTWGYNFNGQLGNGNTLTSKVPTQVTGLTSGVTSISVGQSHMCAIVNGSAKAWGNNANGQLGNNTLVSSLVPIQVNGLTSGITDIAGGPANNGAIVNGAVLCWGLNASGQLGNGSTTNSSIAVAITNPATASYMPYTFTYTINGGATQSTTTVLGTSIGVAASTANAGTFTYTIINVTDANGCSSASNKSTVVTVNNLPNVGLTVFPNTTVCQGSQLTLSGTGANTYSWTGGISDATPFTVNAGATYTVTGTDGNGCKNQASQTITATVPVVPAISLNASSSSICSGTAVTFTATASNAGTNPIYDFKINGTSVQSGSATTYSSSTLANGDAVTCDLYADNTCQTSNMVSSNTVNMSVTAYVTPTVTLYASSNPVCLGNTVILTAVATDAGLNPDYSFIINNTYAQTGASIYYTSSNFATGDTIICKITTTNACQTIGSVYSNAIAMQVNALPVVSTVSSASGPVCQGSLITLYGTGASTYFWNGGITDSLPFSADSSYVYSVTGTDINGCSASSSQVVTTLPYVTPSVSLNASATTICAGASVTFTATATDGGSAPDYTFYVNGTAQQSSSSATFITNQLVNADVVTCTITANNQCQTTSTASSNAISITVNPNIVASVSISSSAASICAGTPLTITATANNAGSAASYDFQVNGTSVQNSSSTTYSSAGLSNGANVTCVLSPANTCQTSSTVNSNNISVVVNAAPTAIITGSKTVCKFDVAPQLNFIGIGGVSPYTFTYTINGGSNLTVSTTSGNSSLVAVPTGASGVYTYSLVSVSGNDGCSQAQNDTAAIDVNTIMDQVVTVGASSVCLGTGTTITLSATQADHFYVLEDSASNSVINGPILGTGGPITFQTGNIYANTQYKIRVYNYINAASHGLTFDGVDDYIETNANIMPLNGNSFTMEAWVKTAGTAMGIVGHTNANNYWEPGEKEFHIDPQGRPSFVGYSNDWITGNMAVNDNTWHHVAVTWNGSTGKVYIDGVDHTGYVGFHSGPNNVADGTFKIGKHHYRSDEAGSFFDGKMDEVRIWNIARSASDIQSHYNTCLTGNESGLVAYWKFEDGQGSGTATDKAGTYNGTLMNFNNNSCWTLSNLICGGSICTDYLSTKPIINVKPLPNATTSGGTTACVNIGAVTLTFSASSATAPYVFSYQLNFGTTQTVTTSGNSVTITVPTTTAGTYNYTLVGVDEANGCHLSTAQTETVQVDPLPTVSLNAVSSVCKNDPSPLVTIIAHSSKINYPLGFTIAYKINGGATQTGNAGINGLLTVPISTTTAGIVNLKVVSVTDNAGCVNFVSDSILITIKPTPTIVVLTNPSTSVCQGDLVTLTAIGASSYSWSGNVVNGSPFTINTSNTYFVVGTGANGCVAQSSQSISVHPVFTPTVSILAIKNPICPGTSITINAFKSNAGLSQVYNFKVNGTTVQSSSSSTFTTSSISNNDIITCDMIATYDGVCQNDVLASSNSITVKIDVLPTASISSFTSVCKNDNAPTVTFTANSSFSPNPAPYIFTYKINNGPNQTIGSSGNTAGVSAPTSTTGTYLYKIVSVQDNIGCIATRNDTSSVVVNALPTIGVTVSPASTVCQGSTITLSGTGGVSYNWSTGLADGTPFTINGSDNFTVIGTDANGCSSTANASVNVLPVFTPTVSISTASSTVCAGAPVTFTASVTNAGINQNYTFKINGSTVQNGASPTFITSSLANGDVVDCDIVAIYGGTCQGPTPASSNSITMTVTPVVVPSVSLAASATTICAGSSVVFTATAVNGGSVPLYTFKINGNTVQSGTSATFSSSILANNAAVTCVMTATNMCQTASTLTSNSISMTVNQMPLANISGTTTICQNATAPVLTFTGLVATPPYTFTYNINGGSATTVTTTSGNSVTVAAPTTTSGTFLYTLTNVQSGAGCSQAVNANATITVQAAPAVTVTPSGPTTFCSGNSVTLTANSFGTGPNSSLNFNANNNQFVNVAHSSSLNLNTTFTIEALVYYNGINRTIIDKGDYAYLFQLGARGTSGLGFFNRNTNFWQYSTLPVPQNTWTHVAVTSNNGAITFYINGVACGTGNIVLTQNTGQVTIGEQAPVGGPVSGAACVCNHMDGSMDELRIWNVARTQSQIATFMNTNVASNSTGLVAYYKFNEGTGGITADATGNGNTGVLNGPTWFVNSTAPVNANTYLWNTSSTSSSITANTSGSYSVTVTNFVGCSTTVTTPVTVNALPTVGFTASPSTSVCVGSPISVNGTGATNYTWTGGISDGSAFYLNNSGSYTVTGTDANGCSNTATATLTALPVYVPMVNINASATTSCAGTSVTFTASATDAGISQQYDFKVNGFSVQSGSSNTYTTTSLGNGDVVTCDLTATYNSTCQTSENVSSNSITMTVNPVLTPGVTISASANGVCTGTAITFTALASNGGSNPNYEFFVNGSSVQNGSASTYTANTFSNGNVVTCVLTANNACQSSATASSNSVTVNITGQVTPAVSIAASATPSCLGSAVSFTATPSNGGPSPSYAFTVNGNTVQSGSSATYTSSAIVNGDVITCTLTANSSCQTTATANSNSITQQVNTPVTPSVAISASTNNVCIGTAVSITATALNGGTAPVYTFKLNGNTVQNGTSATYTSSSFANNAAVTCVMTANNVCQTATTANSNSISMIIKPLLTFYRDADGDGFGNATLTTIACSAPTGFVSNNTDCNDANNSIYPGAPEQNNNIDDNCNGIVDEGFCNAPANFTAVYNATTNKVDVSFLSYTTIADSVMIKQQGYNFATKANVVTTTPGVKTFSFNITSAVNGLQLEFWAKGFCTLNSTTLESNKVVVAIPGNSCAANTVTINSATNTCMDAIDLAWTPSTGTFGDAYRVAYRRISPVVGIYKYKNFTSVSTGSVIALDGNGMYEVIMRRRCNNVDTSNGYFSAPVYVNVTGATTCNKITGVTATSLGCKKIRVKWTAPNCAVQSYTVRYFLVGSSVNWSVINNVTADSLIFFGTLTGSRTYKFYIVPKYCNGVSGVNSDTATVTYNAPAGCTNPTPRLINPTAISGNAVENTGSTTPDDYNVKVFPNPSKGNTSVEWPVELNIASIELYTINGQQLKHYIIPYQQNELHINEIGLANGLYLIILKNVDGAIIQKKNWVVSNR